MKKNRFIIILAIVLVFGTGISAVTAFETPESIIAAGNVYVSNVTYDPGTFFTGDSGTVMVYVTNSNTDTSVVVNHVTIGDENIRLTSRPYDTSANIGPLQTRSFVFSVAATALEGTYYPTFSLNFRDGDSLWYRSMVKIEDTPLILTILLR